MKPKLVRFSDDVMKDIEKASELTGRSVEGFIKHFGRVKAQEVIEKYKEV